MRKLKQLRAHWNEISIQKKVFAYLLVFCVFILGVLWIMQAVFLDDFYRGIKQQQIRNNAIKLEYRLQNSDLAEAINSASEELDACVFVVSGSGTVITSAKTYRRCSNINSAQVNYIKNRLDISNNNFIAYYDEVGTTYDGVLDPLSPFGTGDFIITANNMTTLVYAFNTIISEREFLVVLTTEITPVDAVVSVLRIQLVYVTILMIFMAVLLSLVISKIVSRPIIGISEKAKILAKGEYNVNFDDSGYKEIKELSETLTKTSKDLAKVERLRRELVANISHDLRTPLTLISGYAEAMRDLPDENTYENAEIIIKEANRLSSLVDDALNVSKIQAGTLKLDICEFSLTDLVMDISHRLQVLVKKDKYKIIFEPSENIVIKGDSNKLSQVIYNLLINAINYSGTRKVVTITQVTTKQSVKISVHDTGPGIKKEDLPYIFDRYYKVDKVHRRAVAGSGLGLSIVKSIVELHKGKVDVKTTRNNGSTFSFTLKR